MSSKPWYAWYPSDYKAKTAHLSFLEDAAYRRMLDAYYERAKPLPMDRPSLFRICGAMTELEQAAVNRIASEFFYCNDNNLHNSRCDDEIVKQAQIRARLSEAGKLGGSLAGRGRPKEGLISGQAKGLAQANPHPQPHSQVTPTVTITKTKEGRGKPKNGHDFQLPADIDPQLWQDYIEMRAKIRKPPTDRAKWLIIGKLANLQGQGHDTRKVLMQSIRNCWQDVFPLRSDK